MAQSYLDITRQTSAQLAQLRADIPDTLRGFSAMAQAATKDGALDARTKELIAIALSVAARCDPCVGYHAQALVKLGATRAQVTEALGMAVYMGGGPSLMYAAKASAAFDEFSAAAAAPQPLHDRVAVARRHAQLAQMGAEPVGNTPEQLRQQIAGEITRFAALAQKAKLQLGQVVTVKRNSVDVASPVLPSAA